MIDECFGTTGKSKKPTNETHKILRFGNFKAEF